MKIFTKDFELIQNDIKEGIKQLNQSKNPDRLAECLSFVNFLNKNIAIPNNIEKYNKELESININPICEYIAMQKIKSYYSKNIKNLNRNYGMLNLLSKEISGSLNNTKQHVDINYNLINRADYSEEEMYTIIKEYYEELHDLESLELFNYLIQEKSIYDTDFSDYLDALVTTSIPLNKSYILTSNNHSIETIVSLIHEIRHLKEWLKIKNSHRLFQYRSCNNFVEVGAKYEEKNFIAAMLSKPELKEKAINMHYYNYEKLISVLGPLKKLYNSSTPEDIEQLIYLTNYIYGEIFSDILLSSKQLMVEGFFQSLDTRKNLFCDSGEFKPFGLTIHGVTDQVVKQYRKI